MKPTWLGYLVYSLGNCLIKLYIETSLIVYYFLCTIRKKKHHIVKS